jgi:hypothetical protein
VSGRLSLDTMAAAPHAMVHGAANRSRPGAPESMRPGRRGSGAPAAAPAASGWRRALSEYAVATILYLAATIYFTWPLARVARDHVMARQALVLADHHLVMWIMSAVLRALTTAPARLYEANALHPTPHVIAHSEHLLGDQLVFAPVFLATENPVLGMNLVVLTSYVLAAVFMHALVRRWTGSAAAAVVAALAFAFAPWRLEEGLPHLLPVQYLPLIVLLLDAAIVTGRTRAALAASVAVVLQVLCSYYLGYMAAVVVGCQLAANALVCGVRGRARAWRAVAVVAAVTIAVIVPISLPYLQMRAAGDLTVDPGRLALMYGFAYLRAWRIVSVYVGMGTLVLGMLGALGAAGAGRADRVRGARVLGLVLCAMVGFFLALGPHGVGGWFSPYAWLGAVVPGFDRMRAPIRFGAVSSFGMSALAGFAVAAVLTWSRAARRGRAWGTVAVTLALITILAHPARMKPQPATPAIAPENVPAAHRWLARHGDGGPLVELPIGASLGLRRQVEAARAMFLSTYHWLPLVNGHTGFFPPAYGLLERYAEQLPAPAALDALAACTGVRWILVHASAQQRRPGWAALPGIRLRETFAASPPGAEDRLYEVSRPFDPNCVDRLFGAGAATAADRAAATPVLRGALVVGGLDAPVPPGGETPVIVNLRNNGPDRWRGRTAHEAQRLALRVRWEVAGDAKVRAVAAEWIALPTDVEPGEMLRFEAWIRQPFRFGDYTVTVALTEDGEIETAGPATTDAPRWTGRVAVAMVPVPSGAAGPPPQ